MKVKKQKPSDIADAFKQLKINDRRLRFPFRLPVFHPVTIHVNSCSSRRLHSRLKRSASSANANAFDFSCCHACEYCNGTNNSVLAVNACKQFTANSNLSNGIGTSGQILYPFSSFTKSTGLLHSAVVSKYCTSDADFEAINANPSIDVSHVLEPKHLRHSCGTELSNIDREQVNFTPATESPSSLSSHTPYDRPFCCCHHDTITPLTLHLRLYRRLYSLVDHPCVSFYPCRRHTCTHATLPRGAFSFRHSLSLKNRQCIAQSSLYRLNTSSCSKSPETESEVGVADCKYSETPKPTSHDFQVAQFGITQSNIPQPRIPYYDKFIGRGDSNEDSNLGSPRCRRNSDPEQWQQMRSSQVQNFGTAEQGNIKLNDSADNVDDKSYTNSTVLTNNVCGCFESAFPIPAKTSEYSNSTQTRDDVLNDIKSCDKTLLNQSSKLNVRGADQYLGSLTYTTSSVGHTRSQGEITCSAALSDSEHAFRFRSPILNQDTQQTVLCPLSVASDSGLCSSVCSTTSSYYPVAFSTTQSSDQVDRDKNSALWLSNQIDESLHINSSNLQNRMVCTNSINSSEISPESTVIGNKSNMSSDISVNELASYMEHMVHIPGRMSEMAQRMYL